LYLLAAVIGVVEWLARSCRVPKGKLQIVLQSTSFQL
jgi:hypothetical protein